MTSLTTLMATLLILTSLIMTSVSFSVRSVSVQTVTATCCDLSDTDQVQQVLNAHNGYRADEFAENMEYMTWNDSLAQMAAAWASQCSFSHNSGGQNLYVGNTDNCTVPVMLWVTTEKQYFLEDGVSCVFNEEPTSCAHYSQVVWATSNQVGCGSCMCETVANLPNVNNALVFVCNYSPAGNYVNASFFSPGQSCCNCPSDMTWCLNDWELCAAESECYNSNSCSCRQSCKNNAVLNSTSCLCQCSDGWMGDDCSEECVDSEICNSQSGIGYTVRDCVLTNATARFVAGALQDCPAMCGLCQPLKPTTQQTTTLPQPTPQQTTTLPQPTPQQTTTLPQPTPQQTTTLPQPTPQQTTTLPQPTPQQTTTLQQLTTQQMTALPQLTTQQTTTLPQPEPEPENNADDYYYYAY